MQIDREDLEAAATAVMERRIKPDMPALLGKHWVVDHDKVLAEAAITTYLTALASQEGAQADEPLTFTYRNWRGEVGERKVIPRHVHFGSTEWHPEPQWLLCAFDLDKQADRDFAIKDIGAQQNVNAAEAERAACLDCQPSTAENPNESAYERGRFDGIMEFGRAIANRSSQEGARAGEVPKIKARWLISITGNPLPDDAAPAGIRCDELRALMTFTAGARDKIDAQAWVIEQLTEALTTVEVCSSDKWAAMIAREAKEKVNG